MRSFSFILIIFHFNINYIFSLIIYEDKDGNSYPSFNIQIEETFNKSVIINDTKKIDFNDKITSEDIINEMGFGWNLGNTLDAHKRVLNQGLNSETYWGNPFTTEEIIKGISEKGIKTIRIPVTWHNHIIDLNYTIDPEWMKRVKTIVDWSINQKLYVILNCHHDYHLNYTNVSMPYGKGYYPLKKDKEESEKFLYNIWKQITEAFNNGYDHHLIFEPLNEPHLEGSDYSWKYVKGNELCEDAVSTLNEYMNVILKTIRESGGNNQKRFILICPLMASTITALNSDFIFPSDKNYNPNNNKLILSVHSYTPSDFAGSSKPEEKTYKDDYNIIQYDMFFNLYEKFILNGYNIIFGEFGAVNKNNTEERIKWGKYYIETAKKFHMSCIIWDNGKMENIVDIKSVFGIYDRRNIKWIDDNLINSYVNFASIPMENNPEIKYFGYNLNEDFIFDNWKNKMRLEGYIFRLYNSFCRLCLKLNEPNNPSYKALSASNGDWTERFIFNNSELKNAIFREEDNSTRPFKGNLTLEIFLNPKNYEMARNKGIIFFGHNLIAKEVYISGPRFLKMEPMKIIRSQNSQKIFMYFTENATNLTNNIIFENVNYNINKQISCEVDNKNETIIICEGIFNFTEEYIIKDSNNYLLTNRKLSIIPGKGEKYNINNLIDSKINFDDENLGIIVHFSEKKFSNINDNTKLMIEIDDLYLEPKFRALYIYKGKTSSIIIFDQSKNDIKIGNDGGIEISSGNQIISINLSNNYKTIQENGITIKGYGFSLKSIYFNEVFNENENKNDNNNNNNNDNNSDYKIWIIILIIFVILVLIAIIIFIIIKKSKKPLEKNIDDDFSGNEKILNEV